MIEIEINDEIKDGEHAQMEPFVDTPALTHKSLNKNNI